MRQIGMLLVTALAIGCGKKPDPTPQDAPGPSPSGPGPKEQPGGSDEQRAQGAWKPVKVEVPPGDPEPKAEQLSAVSVVVKSNLLTISQKGRPDQHFTFKLDPTRSPKQVDFVEADASGNARPKGETFPAIYKQEGEKLVIATAVESAPKGYRPTEFKAALTKDAKPGQQHYMVVVLHLARGTDSSPKDTPVSQPSENQGTDVTQFPTVIVGKWTFKSGITGFPIFRDAEFTKDGRVLMLDRATKKWEEEYTYRFDKSELVLTRKTPGGKPEERRVKVASISAEKLVAASPQGELQRIK